VIATSSVISLADAEDAIRVRIEATVPGLYCEATRSLRPDEYKVRTAKALALVMFTGDGFDRRQRAAAMWERSPRYGIMIGTRSLRQTKNQQGAYAYLEAIRDTLTDFEVVGSDGKTLRLEPVSTRFLQETKEGVFWYLIEFRGKDLYHLTA
jgi:hypothetical protein